MKNFSTRFFIVASLLLVSSICTIAQPTILGTSAANGTYTSYNLTDMGTFRQVKILATSSGSNRVWEFGIGTAASPDLSTNWRPTSSGTTLSGFNSVISPSVTASAKYHTSSGGAQGKIPAIVAATYYTFNVQENSSSDNYMAVLSTAYNPASITSVSKMGMNSSDNPNPNTQIYIQITTNTSDGATYFLRYSTTSSFTTSTLVAFNMNGRSGYATIPAQTVGTTIYYNVFSSNQAQGVITSAVGTYGSVAYDMLALSKNDNNGNNYQFTVATPSPLTGTYTINNSLATGGTNFNSFYDAFSSLNVNGVGSGGATFNVVPGFTETNSNLTLFTSGTSSNPIVFQKSGSGTNPKITASSGSSDAGDAVIKLVGSDYITFDGIDLSDPNSYLDSIAVMEAGYALVKFDENDGCQNITIKNCSITLTKNVNYSTGFFPCGIYQAHRYPNGGTMPNLMSSTSGAQSNNKFYNNTIKKVRTGIYLIGYNASTPYFLYDQNNDIGGSTYAMGNVIQNFSDSIYGGYGMLLGFQNNLNICYNRINNSAGGGIATPYTSGISFSSSNNASVTLSNNKITLAIARYTSTSDGAIMSSISGTGTITMQYDTITGCSISPTLSSSDNYNMVSLGSPGKIYFQNCYIGNNTISSLNTITYFGFTASADLSFKNNFFGSESLAVSDNAYMLFRSGSGSGKINISGNIFSSLNKTSGTANVSNFYMMRLLGSAGSGTNIDSIYNNNITGVSLNSVNSFYGIYEESATNEAKKIYGNSISNITNANSVFTIYSTSTSGAVNLYNNSLSTINGTLLLYGIYTNGNSSSAQFNVYGNDINGMTNSSAVATNIINLNSCLISFYRNKIYNIQSTNASGQVYGIGCTGLISGSMVYNNIIGDLKTPSSANTDAVRGIYIASGNVGVYFNSIYLTASSTAATFGSDAIYYTVSASLDLRNNIIMNLSTPGSSGKIVGLKLSGTSLANYSTLSNNNLFYCGTPAANRLIFYDGTNSHQTVSSFQGYVGPTRESSSFSEAPVFLSTTASNINFLHLDPSTNCKIKSRGIVVSGITSDYDNDVRSTINPDPGADEFQATTQGEWTGASSTDWAVTTNWCSGGLPTSTTNVNISTYALFQPTISSNAVANNLIINPTTTLTLQSGILGIYGNLTNNGTYNQTGGTLEMDGSNGQSLPPITVYDFVMNDPNGVTLSGDLTITNSLSLLTGLINTSSNRVIVSNSSSHAIVGYQNDYSQSSYAFSSYINGTLRRAISNGLYYDFPVGTSSLYELASLNINSVSGISTIDVSFSSNNIGCTNPNPANLNVNGTPISVLQDAGHWSYSPDNISGSIDYDLTEYMRGSTNPAPAPTYYALIKREDCSHDWYNPGTQDGSLQDEQLGTIKVSATGITTFSDGGIGHGGNALPVQLSSFYAKPVDNSYVNLNWTTASEINNNHFEVERSKDGVSFSSIGNVKGAGTSTVLNKYSFNDENPYRGVSYYRIKQVDNDGKFSYSVIRNVTLNSQAGDITLSPNPANDNINISAFEKVSIKKILVTDLSGKILMDVPAIDEATDLEQSIDISKLPAGFYFLHIETESENFNMKFLKQ